ncbi:hypothetical protein GCM10010124_26020 [Pilimelia terevasa]|uniref:Uncharacterized protein n=1 Tax=Pilimelia terevasa TaxID=53372 RepID=A0A8J3FIC5_9ACTN|nr:hypothetical protein [Pilimelia terevasa]GGK32058.1 hypothetical protein GCM10010124_26020 [Pilimelia terevasa]
MLLLFPPLAVALGATLLIPALALHAWAQDWLDVLPWAALALIYLVGHVAQRL